MPLMRPVMFEEPDNDMAPTTAISGTYLWGPAFLVAPVTEPGAARKEMYFPKIAGHPEAAWYDFYTGAPHRGGIIEVVPTVREHIPTFVRAGAFVPLATPVLTTRDYTTRQLELHYWHDPAVTASEGRLYDDDGQTARAYETGKYELVRFGARASAGRLDITLAPQPGSAVQPAARTFVLKVHNVAVKPRGVEAGGKALAHVWDEKLKLLEVKLPVLQGTPMQVGVAL